MRYYSESDPRSQSLADSQPVIFGNNLVSEFRSAELPSRPRKLPIQSRSKILVSSIKQAAIMLLDSGGYATTKVTAIAEIAGVTMGSIYQYFPNIEAIISSIYEDTIADFLKKVRRSGGSLAVKLADLSTQLQGLDKRFQCDFYQRYYSQLIDRRLLAVA